MSLHTLGKKVEGVLPKLESVQICAKRPCHSRTSRSSGTNFPGVYLDSFDKCSLGCCILYCVQSERSTIRKYF